MPQNHQIIFLSRHKYLHASQQWGPNTPPQFRVNTLCWRKSNEDRNLSFENRLWIYVVCFLLLVCPCSMLCVHVLKTALFPFVPFAVSETPLVLLTEPWWQSKLCYPTLFCSSVKVILCNLTTSNNSIFIILPSERRNAWNSSVAKTWTRTNFSEQFLIGATYCHVYVEFQLLLILILLPKRVSCPLE